MKINLEHFGKQWVVNLNKPLDLSISYDPTSEGVRCFGANSPFANAIEDGSFVGDVSRGGPVNFFNLQLNVHGAGTHTEGEGHINSFQTPIGSVLKTFHFVARLLTMEPQKMSDDHVITKEQINQLDALHEEALLIRTRPNAVDKKAKNYTGTNPPYFEPAALEVLKERGVKHLLIDLPSVDKEMDEGAVAAHKIWWDYPSKEVSERTITELIFIPDEVPDGMYLLNMQVAPIVLDAAPSRIVIFKMVAS